MPNLSIVIPARNEMFAGITVRDILNNIEADTEVIVVLDGYDIPIPKIPKSSRVRVIKNDKPVGQRAAINQGVKRSRAKYIMKVDAHCSFDKGFDRKMLEAFKEVGDDVTMVPNMKNLHAFDWVCKKCGVREYQGREHPCPKCGGKMKRDIIWKGKKSPNSTAFRFDKTLHFQYWGAYKKKQKGDLVETMSLQGSCFMITRKRYWDLEICDEKHGSWGQQGVEVACKTWLSGGRLLVNRRTWYAHMFRTQGGDFGFPYPNKGIEKAREYSKNLWLNNQWEKAKYPFSWLLEKFYPIPDWDKTMGIIYYTDNLIDEELQKLIQNQIKIGAGKNKIVAVSLNKEIDFGTYRIKMEGKRGPIMMFKQIMEGLKILDTDYVFFCEHDVLYHPSHFKFVPPRNDVYYYNKNVWHLRLKDGFTVSYDAKRLSQLCADRRLLLKHYEERLRRCKKEGFSNKMGYEPGSHNRKERVDDYGSEYFESELPNIDIKHGKNMTVARWNPSQFRSQKSCQNWREGTIDDLWCKNLLG